MQNRLYAVTLALWLVGCQAAPSRVGPPPLFSGGDGSTAESAIVVHVNNEVDGIRAEHTWIHDHIPGGTLQGQELIVGGGRTYDRMQVIAADGTSHKLYFDISQYFGKY
jgi:hypothetical protein